jgi:hypothetical protein
VRRLLDTLDKGLVAQFLALAAWNAPDSGTPEGRRRQLEYLDSGIAAARPDVQLDRLLLVSAHAQRGGSRPRRAMWSRPKRRWRAARECREA